MHLGPVLDAALGKDVQAQPRSGLVTVRGFHSVSRGRPQLPPWQTSYNNSIRRRCMSLLTAAAAPKVAVVGAGVVGLASALHIREELNAEVCIIAEEYGKDTTSYGSGGLWEPYTLAETPEELSNRWGAATFRHFEQLYRTNQGAQEAGVQLVTGFELYSDPKPQRPVWADTVYGFRAVGAEELQAMGFVSHKAGWTFTTFVADQSRYMPRRIESLEPLPSECDVLVNCSGMGAKLLFGDDSMYPVRGQVVRVKAPWVKHVFLVDSESYLIPQVDSVVLGGTRQVGDYNVHADPVDTKSILEKCNRIVAGVADAPVVSEWAGLRPGRQSVRLELGQPLMSNGRSVPIVHNYGHGGAGVTLHWGCAQDVTQLVQAALTTA